MPTTTTSSSSFLFLSFLLLLLIFSASAHSGHHDEDEDEDEESSSLKESDLRSTSLILVKIWCLIIMFIGTFVGGVSPYFFKWNEGFLVLGTQFAGGVFLGTALMHFLSDSNETFEDLTSKEYPFAFMLASFGYLITMLADVVISYVYDKEKSVPAAAVAGGGGGGDVDDVELQGLTEPQGKATSNGKSSQSSSSADDGHGLHFANPKLTNASSLGDSILLIVALCSHSIFEGIAIGIAETKADAWRALWTVSLHKVFAAIAMGIALLRMIPDRPLFSCASYAFAFAISSPIGVAIGIVIDATTQGEVADWIYAISMSLACGVFIYVSINHLLSKGYTPLKATLVDKAHYKFLAVTLGIGVIAIVMIWD